MTKPRVVARKEPGLRVQRPPLGSVAICIATFKRPDWLRRLVLSLSELRFVAAPEPRVHVVVCDNDPDGSAAATAAELSSAARWPVVYVHETSRGIAAARNALVRSSLALDVEAIVFIDDDEVPEPNWLDELLRVQAAHGGDVVVGPVLPQYDAHVPGWVRTGGFFERDRLPTGTELPTAPSGNTLVLRWVLEKVGSFDDRFGLTGGEDTHYFLRARSAGARIVVAAEAVAYETVPANRATVSWLVRRAYRLHNTYVRCERDLAIRRFWLPRRIVSIGGLAGRGLVHVTLGALRGRATAVHGLRDLARACGATTALFGATYSEYAGGRTR